MRLENASVVLDTNAYRYFSSKVRDDLVRGKSLVKRINEVEEKRSIISFISHYVAMELLSHLSDESDPHFLPCFNSTVILYQHNIESVQKRLRFIADPTAQLTKLIYNLESPTIIEFSNRINELIGTVYHLRNDKSLIEIEKNLKDLNSFVKEKEKEFINDMWNSVVKTVDPDANEWKAINKNTFLRNKAMEYLRSEDFKENTARAFIFRAMNALNKTETPKKIEESTQMVLKNFNTSIEFYSKILELILIHGVDVNKKARRNWIWDLQLTFNIGEHQSVGGKKMYFITGDKEIKEAAELIKLDEFILKPEEYLEVLGIN